MTPELRNQIAQDVIADVAKAHGFTVNELQSRRRGRIVKAKAEVAARLKALAFSYPQIGSAMKCHHTTAMGWRR